MPTRKSRQIRHAGLTRRAFVQAAAPAAAFTILPSARAFGSAANSALSIGIVGCGWRGNYLADILKRVDVEGVRVTAVADPFQDQLEATQARFQDDGPQAHRGIDAFRRVLEAGVDAVLITSPPYFHPEQFEVAVDAGVHVYLEKPVSVDAAGARRVREAGRRAQGALTVLVGFQSRSRQDLSEGISLVARGAIGPIVAGRAHYNAGPMGPKDIAGLSSVEQRLRNWVWDRVLSGDIMVEQNVHVLDVCNWVLDAHPVRAFASASRAVRTHWGNTSDNYQAVFWYPNDARLTFSSTQFLELPWGDSAQSFYGPAGAFESEWGNGLAGSAQIRGETEWAFGRLVPNPEERRMHQFVESIRNGRNLNEADMGADSTLTAILARLSAERGREVTWEEMVREDQALEFDA